MCQDPGTKFLLEVGPAVVVAQQLFEHAPVAMLAVNLKGAIQHLNSSTEQLFGYSKEEIVMGAAGLGNIKSFVIGSVSADVLRKSVCPVTIVH